MNAKGPSVALMFLILSLVCWCIVTCYVVQQ
jgi:hypothetical protein